MKRTHGTQLRHLIELLDGAVAAAYDEAGLSYRPRYTPIMRALQAGDALTTGQLADQAGITQPAATQTLALMLTDGLVTKVAAPGDARQKLVRLSAKGKRLLPKLERCWAATAIASRDLEQDLPFSLSTLLDSAISALQAKPFGDRIRAAHATLDQP